MTKQLKDSNFVFNKNNVLIWNVIDTRTAELEVLKSLSFATDERIVFDKPRICSDTASTRVFCMFFDKANGEKGPEFMQFLKNSYGGSLALTIWNDGKNNNASIPVNFADTTSVTQATKLLSSLDKGQWTSIGFLLKQAVNHLKQLPEGDEKRLVVYGNVPDEGKGSQLDPNTWKNLVGVKNLKIYKFLPKGSRKRENDKNFIFGLKYYKLNYIEN